jgi:hypothetical protein
MGALSLSSDVFQVEIQIGPLLDVLAIVDHVGVNVDCVGQA